MQKKIISLLLVLVLVVGLLPTVALADGEPITEPDETTVITQEPTQVTVSFTAQMEGVFVTAPAASTDVTVSSDLAEGYGYTDSVTSGVSALDVLVKAHEIAFEDAFASETADELLVVENGYVKKLFGESTTAFGFAVNGAAPVDTTQTVTRQGYPDSYLGLSVAEAAVADGDVVEFFTYVDTMYYMDYYTWFVDEAGARLDAVTLDAPGDLTLKVTGYMYGMWSMTIDEAYRNGSQTEEGFYEETPLALVDAQTGEITPFDPSAEFDDEDSCTVSFAEPGEYLVTVLSNDYTDVIMPLLRVTVNAAAPQPEPVDITVNVTISKYGEIVNDKDGNPVALAPVTLTGKAAYTVDDALYAAHEAFYEGGAAAGYGSVDDATYGKSLTKLWGDENSRMFGYQVDHGDVSVWNLDTAVTDGCTVDAYIMQSSYPDSEPYVRFDQTTATVTAGEALTLTLEESYWDESFNMQFAACEGATITANGTATTFVTAADGTVSVTFAEAGTYVVSAVKTKTVNEATVTAITAPACIVTVEAAAVQRGDMDGNGTVNMRDLLMLRQHLAGGYGIALATAVADLDGNGTVNMRDLLMLRQYLAGGYGIVL
ncbi:MAG: hypothetical protein IJT18_06675 [Oscillospiraceae bacterium]|nr:hypothetical protein [Oscillospiraceae bacterium]